MVLVEFIVTRVYCFRGFGEIYCSPPGFRWVRSPKGLRKKHLGGKIGGVY